MGVATIVAARRVLLCATGESKSKVMSSLLSRGKAEYDPLLPATALLRHPGAHFYLDKAAAQNLK
jgi:6-phosphogluconolactonase/glucosamine-6-phosphate isomerase/deaminase